jgi:hypothetical protein
LVSKAKETTATNSPTYFRKRRLRRREEAVDDVIGLAAAARIHAATTTDQRGKFPRLINYLIGPGGARCKNSTLSQEM